jgi:hypothetical protein
MPDLGDGKRHPAQQDRGRRQRERLDPPLPEGPIRDWRV